LVTTEFKSGGLHEKHVEATWKGGNHLGLRETKKNLCLDGRSQDLPDTDIGIGVRFPVGEINFLFFNPLNAKLNLICHLLALLGAHHILHVSRIRVKLLTFRLLMSYIYIWSTHS
jgi:hypothetical protein